MLEIELTDEEKQELAKGAQFVKNMVIVSGKNGPELVKRMIIENFLESWRFLKAFT